jgi:hypothetical protein
MVICPIRSVIGQSAPISTVPGTRVVPVSVAVSAAVSVVPESLSGFGSGWQERRSRIMGAI